MMKPIKLVVFMLDALCTLDLDQIRTLPNMGAILKETAKDNNEASVMMPRPPGRAPG